MENDTQRPDPAASETLLPPVPKPEHVPDALVVQFDFYHPGPGQDIHEAFRAVQERAPDVFWTPYNGGHWVAARADVIEEVQRDWRHFSNRDIAIPKPPGMARLYPQEADPPLHAHIRDPIKLALLPREVKSREDSIRSLAIDLIEGFLDRGECEFIGEFASILPLCIFLDFVNLPREDRVHLSVLADIGMRAPTLDERADALLQLEDYLRPIIRARREDPGSDVLSKVVTIEIDGKRIDEDMAMCCTIPLMAAGLDTVASMLGFMMHFLALHPEHRTLLVERRHDTDFLKHAIEELLRRHGIANPGRVVIEDIDFHGAPMRAGEPVLIPTLLYGLDNRKASDPMTVDFTRRGPIRHAAFSHGPHMCPGAGLARSEIRIVLEEWLTRIPDFSIKKDTSPNMISGLTIGMHELHLAW